MKYPTFYIISRTIRQARGFYPYIIILFLLNLLATPIALLKPLALKLLIDSGFGKEPVPGFISDFFPAGFAFTFSSVAIIAASLVILVALIDNINGVVTWVLETYTGRYK